MTRRPTLISRLSLLVLLPTMLLFAACGDTDAVEFGAALPLTGSGAVYGNSIKNGAEVAIELLNAKGEMPKVMSLRIEDTASDPAQAKAAVESIFTTSIAAIGGVTSDEAIVVYEVADSVERVLLSPTASSPQLKRASRYMFMLFPNVQDEAVTMAGFLQDILGRDKIGILAEETAFGEDATLAFQENFSGELTGVRTFSEPADVAALATELKEAGAQGVYVGAIGDRLVAAVQAARAAGLEVYATSALLSPEIIAAAGEAAEGAFLTSTEFDGASENPLIAEFASAFEAKFGSPPDLYAAYGFDSILVLAEAYKEWGGGPIAGDFIKGMRGLSNLPGVTGNIQFREDGSVQKFNRAYRLVDGSPVDYVKWRKGLEDEMKEKQRALQKKMEALRRQSGG